MNCFCLRMLPRLPGTWGPGSLFVCTSVRRLSSTPADQRAV